MQGAFTRGTMSWLILMCKTHPRRDAAEHDGIELGLNG